jgi:ABC-2 type transport system ATP-binding protein
MNPDEGSVAVFGKALSEETKSLTGYLPEERGLYQNAKVGETLQYLATLKGMDEKEAGKAATSLLERVGLGAYADSKVNELSKGMQQKVQFAATVIHKPKLVVLDEPFSGLDPVNSELIKDMILELKASGTAVILSTHQMEQVERMCDRVLMINKGRTVLYGSVKEIKASYGKNTLNVTYSGRLPAKIPGVKLINDYGNYAELALSKGTKPSDVALRLLSGGLEISKFELSEPSFNQIFIEVANA